MPIVTKTKPPLKKMVKKTIGRQTQSSSVLDRIRPMEFNPYLKILIYGVSGTGKTTTWATFPGKILSIICSGGNKSGELRSVNTKEYREKIKQVEIKSCSDLVELINFLSTDDEFSTVVLDHASGFQDLKLKEILGIEEIPVQKSWGLASQQQYGQCTLECKETLRALLNLDKNVIIIAQERDFKNEGADGELLIPVVGAALSPSLTGWLNTAVDYICQTFKRQKEVVKTSKLNGKTRSIRVKTNEVEYCLRTGPSPVYTTKFRIPKGIKLPEIIVDPSYDKMVELFNS